MKIGESLSATVSAVTTCVATPVGAYGASVTGLTFGLLLLIGMVAVAGFVAVRRA